MKVLQINNSEAIIGGSERVYHLTSELLARNGHQVCSLSCGDAAVGDYKRAYLLPRNGYYGSSPLATLHNSARFVHRSEAARLLEDIVQRERPDIAHLHIFYGQLSSAILPVLRRYGIPTVMSVHEYRMLCPTSTLFRSGPGVCEACASGRRWRAVRNACNRGSRAASALSALECYWRDALYPYAEYIDQFVMVSEFCRKKHLQYQPALGDRSCTIYNFIDAKPIADVAEAARGAHFLYAGRLSPEKGVAELLAAVASTPGIALRVAGAGSQEGELRQSYARTPNIEFLGKLSRDALAEQMRAARYCVVPSIWYENNPMSVLESFAEGTPVLGSDIGGIPELVSDGVTGLLFAPDAPRSLRDALVRAAAVPEAVHRDMRERCRTLVVERHAPRVHLDALLAAYESAQAHARARRGNRNAMANE
jgi:glycosyltransferase involved in cell wall biosynthesis